MDITNATIDEEKAEREHGSTSSASIDNFDEPENIRQPITKTVTAQDWNGPDDPENPLNWSMFKRCYNTGVTALLGFAVTFGSSVYTPGYPGVQQEFGVSQIVALLPLALYVFGLGAGPALAAPFSETHGRVIVYWVSVPLSMLFTIGAGFSQTLPQLTVCRFFAGMFASPVLAVGSGTNLDLWPPKNRAIPTSFFLMAPFLGPAFGPLVGGFSIMTFSWRWTQWDILFVMIPVWVASFFQKETYKKIILQRRAKRLNIPKPVQQGPQSTLGKLKVYMTVTLVRPVHMIFTEPIVAWFSLYIAFSFGVLFAFFPAFPVVFIEIYGFNPGESGLAFLGVGVGVVLSLPTALLIDKYIYVPKHELAMREGKVGVAPEHRLYAAMIGSFGLPIGVFWFAWTARPEVHWISPVLAAVPFGWGNTLIFLSAALYLTDVYGPLYGASAMAGNGLMRYCLGAVSPLFAIPMYNNLPVNWATSIFGFIYIAMLPIPWVLFKFGPRIRARSGYDVVKL